MNGVRNGPAGPLVPRRRGDRGRAAACRDAGRRDAILGIPSSPEVNARMPTDPVRCEAEPWPDGREGGAERAMRIVRCEAEPWPDGVPSVTEVVADD